MKVHSEVRYSVKDAELGVDFTVQLIKAAMLSNLSGVGLGLPEALFGPEGSERDTLSVYPVEALRLVEDENGTFSIQGLINATECWNTINVDHLKERHEKDDYSMWDIWNDCCEIVQEREYLEVDVVNQSEEALVNTITR
jgi:hypothetical protein